MSGAQVAAGLGGEARDAARERRIVRRRSMNTVSDDSPMTSSTTATVIAGQPMCDHISLKLNPMLGSFPVVSAFTSLKGSG